MEPIALVCAVELEAAPILDLLVGIDSVAVHRRSAYAGRLDDQDIVLLIAGMGKSNASQALASLFERRRVSGLVGFGVGGAYEGSALSVGDVAIAISQHYGDEGVQAPGGWLSCEGIGIPLAEIDGVRYFNDFPVDVEFARAASARLESRSFRVGVGPFVTVSSCSGTTARGAELVRRFGGICETMEGAAYAHVAALYDIPYGEIRGISNLVEDRDMKKWKLREAAAAAGEAVVAALGCQLVRSSSVQSAPKTER